MAPSPTRWQQRSQRTPRSWRRRWLRTTCSPSRPTQEEGGQTWQACWEALPQPGEVWGPDKESVLTPAPVCGQETSKPSDCSSRPQGCPQLSHLPSGRGHLQAVPDGLRRLLQHPPPQVFTLQLSLKGHTWWLLMASQSPAGAAARAQSAQGPGSSCGLSC